ncbi:MAG: hypothetical protein ACMUIU_11525 [bacterium]
MYKENKSMHKSKLMISRSGLFAGLLCSGVVTLAFVLYPNLFPIEISFVVISGISFLLGLFLHRWLNVLTLNLFGKFMISYVKLAQLTLLTDKKLISKKTYRGMVNEILLKYFLKI